MKDYLSYQYQVDVDGKKHVGWMGQPHMISVIKKEFGAEVEKVKKCLTPTQSWCCQSLYTTITVRAYACCCTWSNFDDQTLQMTELSKVLSGTTEAAQKEMLRVVKYVLTTGDLELKRIADNLSSDGRICIVAHCDNDWSSDPDSQRSVRFPCVDVLEPRDVSHLAVRWLSDGIGIQVELSMTVCMDNIGAVFLMDNVQVNDRTEHIDIRSKFVKELVMEDGALNVLFVQSEHNDLDIRTKKSAVQALSLALTKACVQE
ncbi:LOW QUALITY PROTEIN: hypothetical protein ACHAWF_003400, partial [Thalassiosira exigua]